MKRIRELMVLVLVLGFAAGAGAIVPGDLDTSFNYPTGFADYAGPGERAFGTAVAVQSDGKIVVVGIDDNGADDDIVMLRYKPDGTLDTGFGMGGVVIYDEDSEDDGALAVAVLPSGKILVAGYIGKGGERDGIVLRFNSVGTLDTSFGFSGKLYFDHAGTSDNITSIALQSDGKIVCLGQAYDSGNLVSFMFRLSAGGAVDAGFGSAGKVLVSITDKDMHATALAVQPDDKILLAGYSDSGEVVVVLMGTDDPNPGQPLPKGAEDADLHLMRFDPNGGIDVGFATAGMFAYDAGGDEMAFDIALQPDGKILLTGAKSSGTTFDALTMRFTTSGTLDTSFGTGGMAIYDGGGHELGTGIAVQPDGKIVVAGIKMVIEIFSEGRVLRYQSNGALDSSFGSSGVASIPEVTPGVFYMSTGRPLALQSDGGIILAGYRVGLGASLQVQLAVARLFSALSPPEGTHIYPYHPVVVAVGASRAEYCKPVSVGSILGGILQLSASLPVFNDFVDVYVILQSDALGPNNFYVFTEGGGIQFLTDGLDPWRSHTLAGFDAEQILPDLATAGMPEGIYNVYFFVLPDGSADLTDSYIWATYFVVQ